MKKISILGSTGSIGVSTLDVVFRHPDRFDVVGLAAGNNVNLLVEQIQRFQPKKVSVRSLEQKKALESLALSWDGNILVGEEGAREVAVDTDANLVVSAIVGAAGLVKSHVHFTTLASSILPSRASRFWIRRMGRVIASYS